MAKGIGLIGNFKGKVGNMVGYKLSDSNTGNTQGIRVYQPIVRNPKTSAQAEQRAKLAPINATYRALKMIIDRGNEGLPYGNKSRLAWLKQAFKAEHMPWIEKGGLVKNVVVCPLTKGSLSGFNYAIDDNVIVLTVPGLSDATAVNTIGAVSTALKTAFSYLKDGDQVTFVGIDNKGGSLNGTVFSIVIDTTSTEATTKFAADPNLLNIEFENSLVGCAVILSREGANGEHLRSTQSLFVPTDILNAAPYIEASKTAAVESYMNAAGANSDWAEESIQ